MCQVRHSDHSIWECADVMQEYTDTPAVRLDLEEVFQDRRIAVKRLGLIARRLHVGI